MPLRAAPSIFTGGYSSTFAFCLCPFAFILAPIILKGRITLSIGRRDKDSSAVRQDEKPWAANNPTRSLKVVPDSPKKIGLRDFFNPQSPLPNTAIAEPDLFRGIIFMPNFLKASIVKKQSWLLGKFLITVLSGVIALRITARWAIDLSPKSRTSPLRHEAAWTHK